MATFNPAFWEVGVDATTLDRVPAHQGLWFETEVDQARRHALKEFYAAVRPEVEAMVKTQLTERQREVIWLYYFHGKTQEDIAAILNLTQSTVSRHLFGTTRDGKKVGGALQKLRKVIEKQPNNAIEEALEKLQGQLAEAV